MTTTQPSPSEPAVFRNYDPSVDADLIEQLIYNEPGAWREFQRRFDRLIQKCIFDVLGKASMRSASDAADEIYAEFLLSLMQRDHHKLRVYDHSRGARFSTWLALLATNAAWDHVRGISRRKEESTALEQEYAVSPHDVYEVRQDCLKVNCAVSELSPRDQEFVQHYFVEHLDPVEIADRMRISLKTVYSKKHKIQTRLSRSLMS